MKLGKQLLMWLQSTLAKRMVFYSVIFSAITVTSLMLLSPSTGVAKEHGSPVASGAAAAPMLEGADSRFAGRTVKAVQANQALASGMVYAPRDVVDMTRLVLEVSRDQTTHSAHYIEMATTVIVVFFSVIGAVGAAFGMHKIGDIERSADKIKQRIETQMQEKIDGLHREINDQAELLTGKAEINTAGGDAFLINNAAQRIKAVLDRNHISKQSRIRGLADYAYAIKRTGDVRDALRNIQEAAALAKEYAPKMFPLVAFNAACYESILGNSANALDWLKQAIEKNPTYKDLAKKDADFSKLSELDEFKELTK